MDPMDARCYMRQLAPARKVSIPKGNFIIWSNYSDLTRPGPPNGGLVREMGLLISGKSKLMTYYNLARIIFHPSIFQVKMLGTQVSGEYLQTLRSPNWKTIFEMLVVQELHPSPFLK